MVSGNVLATRNLRQSDAKPLISPLAILSTKRHGLTVPLTSLANMTSSSTDDRAATICRLDHDIETRSE